MRKALFIITICLVMAMLSCSGDEAERPAAPSEPTAEELEARVIENCHILEEALEAFMEDNELGRSPWDILNDTNDAGLTVIDYLPGGELMENPFTGERTEPVDTIATEPGQTGYYKGCCSVSSLYYINGFGETYMIVELSNIKELEWRFITNCLIFMEASERFASLNGGIYPSDTSLDTTPEGFTLIDLLPGGRRLFNPFTNLDEEPTDGAAATPGDTGYVPIVIGGYNAGYVITGCGRVAAVTIFCRAYSPNENGLSIFGEIIYCVGDHCPE